MKNSENPKFEESWRSAFADAEANPPDASWNTIDMHLSKVESGNMKKRVVFYQRLAAAAVLFGLSLGSVGLWYLADREETISVNSIEEVKPAAKNSELKRADELIAEKKSIEQNKISSGDVRSENRRKLGSEMSSANNTGRAKENAINKDVQGTTGNFFQSALNANEQNAAATPGILTKEPRQAQGHNLILASNQLPVAEIKLNGKPVEEIVEAKMLARQAIVRENSKRKSGEEKGWWAAIGGSGGNYDTQPSVLPTSFSASRISNNSSFASSQFMGQAPMGNQVSVGTSYSVGMTVGKKIAKRWVLITGVNYLNQSIGYQSNLAVLDANNQAKAFLAGIADANSNVTATSQYNINSINEFVSIPVQAGYLFLDRKVGLQLNAGVSSDLFYRNTLVDESKRLSNYSESAGDDSAYRTLNWTGLVGTELSYKMSKHYRVSFVPGLRYSFNSVLKSSNSVNNPIVWDIGFRFRYLF